MAKPESPPNVLVVFADQHRASALGCAGNPDVRTPNIDRLAAGGTRFSRAVANAPVCGPSRACLLTGQYPLTHSVVCNDLPLPVDAPSIAERFSDAGYRTGYVGKWHLDGVPRDKFTPPGPRRQGFDDYWAVWNCSHDHLDAKYYEDTPEPKSFEAYEPVGQTDLALDFVEGAAADEPFCLFLSWGPPHACGGTYDCLPDRYDDLYDGEDLAMRPNAEPSLGEFGDHLSPRETLAQYYGAVTAIDEQFGRLLDRLDELGIAEETIVVYTSDHGDMLWSQGYLKKEAPWVESTNVPFVIRYPGTVGAGVTESTPLGTADVAPTLLGLAGIDPHGAMEGTDFAPFLRGEDAAVPAFQPIMEVVRSGQARQQDIPEWRGVVTERYTYARLRDGEPWLLYDDREDPHQLRNRAYDSGYREVRDSLDALTGEWLAERDDRFLDSHEHVRELGVVEAYNERFEAFPWLDSGGKIEPG